MEFVGVFSEASSAGEGLSGAEAEQQDKTDKLADGKDVDLSMEDDFTPMSPEEVEAKFNSLFEEVEQPADIKAETERSPEPTDGDEQSDLQRAVREKLNSLFEEAEQPADIKNETERSPEPADGDEQSDLQRAVREKLNSLFEEDERSPEPADVRKSDSVDRIEAEAPDDTVKMDALHLPRSGGHWSDEPGNSKWFPDRDTVPGDRNGTNPEQKTWGEILDKYGIDHIAFKDGDIDLSSVARGQTEIDDFSSDRAYNFDQADKKLAEQRGCTPEEVAKWRKEHGYTWHECSDCRTMQKVPTEVHGNIPHSGGISAKKEQEQNM